jgi:replicative DNA helicase
LESFVDKSAETDVVAGVVKYGRDAFIDVDDHVEPEMLSDDLNRCLLAIAKEHFGQDEDRPLDYPTILSIARRKGWKELFEQDDVKAHYRSLMKWGIAPETVRPQAAKILRLNWAKRLDDACKKARIDFHKLTGDESIEFMLALIENPLLDLSASLDSDHAEGPVQIAEGGEEWLEHILANPCDNIGIPSPFPTWNEQIGGGFRPETVSLVGARPKVGKTVLADNICMHAAGTLGIPVLNVDSEMTRFQHLARILAHATGIESGLIERGQVFGEDADRLREKMAWLKTIPYSYESVVSRSFDQQTASMRRWVLKNVPLDENGRRGPSLIVYDYLQVADETELSNHTNESQMLGFKMMSLLRIAERLSTSVFSLIQLNRDGDERESSTVVFGSDRPVMRCANFSILKWKSESELKDDGTENGTHKLVNVMTRFGTGGQGNYISIHRDGGTARMREGKTYLQLRKERGTRPSDEETFDERPKRRRKEVEPLQQEIAVF